MDVMARAKEIQYSSRTRQVSDLLLRQRTERELIARVLAKLPQRWRTMPTSPRSTLSRATTASTSSS